MKLKQKYSICNNSYNFLKIEIWGFFYGYVSKKLKWLELNTKSLFYAFRDREHIYGIILMILGQIYL